MQYAHGNPNVSLVRRGSRSAIHHAARAAVRHLMGASAVSARIEIMESRTLFSAGLLDTSFGTGGTLLTPVSPPSLPVSTAVVAQSNGQILRVNVTEAPTGNTVVKVQRLQSNGTTDSTFGTGGVTTIPYSGRISIPLAGPDSLILQPNGSILVGVGNVLARLTSAGKLDTTFAAGVGYETIKANAGELALQTDGKILAAGGGVGASVSRFNTAGSIDTTYGTNGVATLSSGTLTLGGTGGIAVDGSGRAIVSIPASSQNIPSQYVLARLTTAGKLDTTFGTNGFASDGGQSNDADGFSFVAVAPNGTLYLAGNYDQGDGDESVISAFSFNGTLVAGAPQRGPTFFGGVLSLTVQPDNKLLATGFKFYNSAGQADTNGINTDVFVDRFLAPAGAALAPIKLDTTFNGTGERHISYSAPDPEVGLTDHTDSETGDFGYSVALQSDGKILVAGVTDENLYQSGPATTEFTLARLTADAPVATTGTITGTVFNDPNTSGTQDKNEAGLANARVFLDLKHTGLFATGDPSTLTNSKGVYTLTNVKPGTYSVTTTPPAGYSQDYPFGGREYTASVVAGKTITGDNFGETTTSHVSGTVTSTSAGKVTPVEGVIVTIVAADGKGPSLTRVTGSTGYYGVGGLPNKAYIVTIKLPAGYVLASGHSSQTTPVLKSGQNDDKVNFSLKPASTPTTAFGTSQRSVDIQFNVDPTVFPNNGYPSVQQSAVGNTPFDASLNKGVSTPQFVTDGEPNFINLTGTTSQQSLLTSNEITDIGTVSAVEDDLQGAGNSFVNAESLFQTTFTLSAAQTYDLALIFAPAETDGPGSFGTFTFTGPGGKAVVPAQVGDDQSPFTVQQAGTLAAGTYNITYDIECTDTANNFPNDVYSMILHLGVPPAVDINSAHESVTATLSAPAKPTAGPLPSADMETSLFGPVSLNGTATSTTPVFNDGVSANQKISVTGTATQTSLVTPTEIRDSGTTTGTVSEIVDSVTTAKPSTASASSFFDVVFTLNRPQAYSLLASTNSASNIVFSFTDGNSSVVPGKVGSVPLSVNQSGVLAAGTYDLHLFTSSTARGNGTSTGIYSVDLKLSDPA